MPQNLARINSGFDRSDRIYYACLQESRLKDLYRSLLRPVLFSGLNLDPEWLHQQTLQWLQWTDLEAPLALRQWILQQMSSNYGFADRRLETKCFDCEFINPLGLSAGFDKDGQGAAIWPYFGFGFAELGTVTQHAQGGNPQPRLFRLIEDEAALNRMGFNNQGSLALVDRLQHRSQQADRPIPTMPIGINLGKSKITALEDAAGDYLESFRRLRDLGQYFVINVSSPNTPGLRSLQSVEQLTPIFAALSQENDANKPILVKIAPDLTDEDILAVVDLARQFNLAGIIATNTTIRRDGLKTQVLKGTGKPIVDEAGGISGVPVRSRSTEVIRLIYRHTKGEFPIVGVGGIFNADDAWEKITAGASLLQVYTGWIYEGPAMVRQILSGLVARLDAAGLDTLDQAVGLEFASEKIENWANK
jgi:dihydroorotate dehydrogenase